ncbi:MAG: alpha/beta fold hydrolase [Paracoccaceae bacterium]
MIALQTFGSATALPPLMIVHGLFGSGRNWGAIARRLAGTRMVLVPDMRNHAGSGWTDSHDYFNMATDLAEIAAAHGQVDVVGHSMGGKASMVLALTRPELLRKMVVADISPVAYGHSQTPLITAMRGLDLTGLTARGEADRRLSMTVPDPGVRAFLLQSLDLKADPPRWRLNLDLLEREMPTVIGWPEINGRFDGPVLFLSGADSDYVQPDHRATIKGYFPGARFAKLPGAGHWLHADRPREFEATLRAFLD